MAWKVPLYKIYHDKKDLEAVESVIERGTDWTNGLEISNLEKELATYSGRKFAVAFNNGTSALHAMLLAFGVCRNDEVIVPSFTFISTANSVLFTGARPVFAEIERETFALDPEYVKKKITEKTKAIMAVHYGGCPAEKTTELKELAERKGVLFLEDAAESIGSKLNGKMVGSFGDAGMFSFCANKVITSGEGGAIITDSEEIYNKLRLLRSHGRAETGNYFNSSQFMDYVSLGYNFRMPSVVAALALSQLKKIDRIISMRREVANQYDKAFSDKIRVPKDGDGFFNVYQMYTILLNSHAQREGLKKHLESKGVMTKVYFDPIHHMHFYKKVLGYNIKLPATEEISERVLTIPLFPDLPNEEIDYICNSIKEYVK